jgi:outer membrane biosynthesis protein TonB
MEMSDKRMGGMKLGNFSGIKKTQAEPSQPPESTPESAPEVKAESEVKPTETEPVKTAKSEAKLVKKTKVKQKKEQLVTVNIKIRKNQKEWLADTASTVRDNNTDPVPPAERVYPQHLIGVAIDFLEAAGVDWGEVRNVEELREQLNL